MKTVSIVGGSGYAGGELLRILINHPEVEIKQVTSERFSGQPVTIAHPNLRGFTSLTFCSLSELEACDILFLGLPNGLSMERIDTYRQLATHVIDLGADFRLNSSQAWKKWYRSDHQHPELLSECVYGLPELHRSEVAESKFVAGPGCEAAVSILSLYPLVLHNLIEKDIIIDAKMSSSQAGNRPNAGSHHPERAGVMRSYAPTGHRHTAEVHQELTAHRDGYEVMISATATDMIRGILVTIHTRLQKNVTEKDIWTAYRAVYGKEPFIRLVKQKQGLYRYPEPKILQGTNFCDIGFELDPHSNRLVIIGAIDNLVKGTAGNGVQCMNLMLGWPETLGLNFPGLHPI